MARFYLVRHGQASFGSDDYDKLSPLGHQQSQWLGAYFKQRHIQFDAVVCGDLVRHQETVEGIFSGLGTSMVPDRQTGLNELDFEQISRVFATQKALTMPTKDAPPSEFYRLLKSALYAWQDEEITSSALETWREFSQRVGDAFAHIQAQYHSQENVLIVSSGGVIGTFAHQLLNTPPKMMVELNMQAYNSGITQGFFNQHVYRLGTFNHVSHLDRPGREHAMTYS